MPIFEQIKYRIVTFTPFYSHFLQICDLSKDELCWGNPATPLPSISPIFPIQKGHLTLAGSSTALIILNYAPSSKLKSLPDFFYSFLSAPLTTQESHKIIAKLWTNFRGRHRQKSKFRWCSCCSCDRGKTKSNSSLHLP